MGVTEHGRKELIAVEEGYRESEASWLGLLNGLFARGLTSCPKLATADGALGFWKALSKVYPQTKQQLAGRIRRSMCSTNCPRQCSQK